MAVRENWRVRKIKLPRLSDDQRRDYEILKIETVQSIQAGLTAFQRTAKKLLRIRDERLYREEFGTFNEFCRAVFGKSKTYVNDVIQGYQLIQDLVAQGETVLPDNERIARQLAKYPKNDRTLIWKRAVQIEGRKKPSYKTLHEAACEIVSSKEVKKIWMGQVIGKLKSVDRSLTMSIDLRNASLESTETIGKLLMKIEKKVSELSIEVGERWEKLKRATASVNRP
jgi:hypothetical protein